MPLEHTWDVNGEEGWNIKFCSGQDPHCFSCYKDLWLLPGGCCMPLPSTTASESDGPPNRWSSVAGTTKLPKVNWGTPLQCPSPLNQQDAQEPLQRNRLAFNIIIIRSSVPYELVCPWTGITCPTITECCLIGIWIELGNWVTIFPRTLMQR